MDNLKQIETMRVGPENGRMLVWFLNSRMVQEIAINEDNAISLLYYIIGSTVNFCLYQIAW